MLRSISSYGRNALRWTSILLAAAIIAGCSSTAVAGYRHPAAPDFRFEQPAKNLKNVVQVATRHTVRVVLSIQTSDPTKYGEFGIGTGYIISDDGFVLTADHVTVHAERKPHLIKVEVDLANGERHAAMLVGADKTNDLSLLYVPTLADKGYNTVKFTPINPTKDSTVKLFAIGAPRLQQFPFVSYGEAFGLTAQDVRHRVFIDHGSSGGPLLNMNGEYVGINVRAYATKIPGKPGRMHEARAVRVKHILNFLRELGDKINEHR